MKCHWKRMTVVALTHQNKPLTHLACLLTPQYNTDTNNLLGTIPRTIANLKQLNTMYLGKFVRTYIRCYQFWFPRAFCILDFSHLLCFATPVEENFVIGNLTSIFCDPNNSKKKYVDEYTLLKDLHADCKGDINVRSVSCDCCNKCFL